MLGTYFFFRTSLLESDVQMSHIKILHASANILNAISPKLAENNENIYYLTHPHMQRVA